MHLPAKSQGQTHLSLTNHSNIDGLLTFQSAADKAGVKPIMGCEFYIVKDLFDKTDKGRFHITALIKNEKGFQNVCKMLTMANLKGFFHKPRIDFERFLKNCEGLVVLSGCSSSPITTLEGHNFISDLNVKIPGDVYLEVMPHFFNSQFIINRKCLEVAQELNLELVATNDCHYINEDDANLHEVLLAIQTKAKWEDHKRFRFEMTGLHLRSEEEMKDAFLKQDILTKIQISMAMRNTMEIAKKCSSFRIKKKDVWLPEVKLKSGEDEISRLKELCEEGSQRRYGKTLAESHYKRFCEEFELIKSKKFVRYFLLVHELISWCKDNGIMTGPGRGSVGGSLIAYLIGITNVDPIEHNLLFSRFIDENRIDLPDIDLDFEDSKRYLVRQHFEELYGKNHVASVSTFMKMKGRAVVRDVARVFDVPYDDVDAFAKSIIDEENENNSVRNAVDNTQEGFALSRKYPKVVDYAVRLEGQIRGVSQHAAALIISAEDLTEGTRGNLAMRSEQEVVNWEKDDAEYMGLMKLDVLGLNTLSVLNEARRLIKENHDKNVDFEKIKTDNRQIFEMLSRGETVGVFQFNTWATTKLVKQVGVKRFMDMSDVLALVRPGPLDSGMTEDYIRRKDGVKWQKKHRIYEKVTKDTFGLVVYQEQVMEVINKVAGLPYTTADKIRKIIGKKRDAKEFKPFEDAFVEGCQKEETLSVEEAKEFWEALQNHARYSFNKSHSVEYSMIAYWCAFLKLYFPAEFLCANLTYGSEGKKDELVKEVRRLGLNIVLPKIGVSDAFKWVVKGGNIYVPFIEIKGVGQKMAQEIATYKPHGEGLFFELGRAPLPGKAGKIVEEIGANGNPPKEGFEKYFSFDVSDYHQEEKCTIHQMKYRNIDLVFCKDCGLRKEAKSPVLPSCGIYNVMIAGEAPGKDEDEKGRGFVGKAGDFLWTHLFAYGITRRQVHVTNICKCYPGSISTPKAEHIEACSKWLDEEIKMTGTKLCFALGNTALKYFKGVDGGITKLCGTTEWIESKKIYVCWGIHPSAVLRNPSNKSLFDEGVKNFVNQIKIAGGFR